MLDSSTLKSSLNTEILPIAFATSPLSIPRQASGSITLNNGQVTTEIQGQPKQIFSIAQLTTDISNSLKQLQGSLTFNQGNVTRDLTTPSGNLKGTFAFAEDAGRLISDFVKGISGSVPFEDGKINVDIPTLLGQVKGSIEFGNGALVTNLTTPVGNYFSSIDFQPSDQFKFQFGNVPGVVNFNDGLVILDFQPQIAGDEIGIPINALRGNVTFKNGQATLNIPTPFGAIATNFDFSALAKTATTNALQGSGTVKFTNGIASIDVSGGLGTVKTTLDFPKLAQDLGTTLATTQGTIRFNNGVITTNLIS